MYTFTKYSCIWMIGGIIIALLLYTFCNMSIYLGAPTAASGCVNDELERLTWVWPDCADAVERRSWSHPTCMKVKFNYNIQHYFKYCPHFLILFCSTVYTAFWLYIYWNCICGYKHNMRIQTNFKPP